MAARESNDWQHKGDNDQESYKLIVSKTLQTFLTPHYSMEKGVKMALDTMAYPSYPSLGLEGAGAKFLFAAAYRSLYLDQF